MIQSSRPPLTEQQKAQIAANRARALERQAQKSASEGATTAAGSTAAAALAPPPIVQQPAAVPAAAAAAPRPTPLVQQPQPMRAASTTEASRPAPMPEPARTNSGPLTAEQQALVQRNKEAALARRAAFMAAQSDVAAGGAAAPPPPTSHSSFGATFAAAAAVPAVVRQPSAPASAPAARPTPIVTSPPSPVYKPSLEATIAVHSADRFKLLLAPYLSTVTDACKIVPSRKWDFDLKANTFSYSDIHTVYKILAEFQGANIRVVKLPDNILHILTQPDRGGKEKNPINPTGDLTSGIDPSLREKLFPFQKKGVEFGIRKGGRVLIADEMGLGKSIQALAIARYYRADFPLAIVCPASVKSAWKLQILKFCPAIKDNLYIMDKEKDPLPGCATSNTVIIMSYDFMKRKEKDLVAAAYSVWIFDESHYIKDQKAMRTRAAMAVAKKARRVILLSGTPALSRPAELFTQIRIIDHKLFTNYKEFAMRYCDGKEGPYGFEAKGVSNSEELSAILQKSLMIRRLKSEVLTDLPAKIREVCNITSADISARIDKSRSTSTKAFDYGGKVNVQDESLLEYYVHTGTAKARPVCDHIIDNYFYDGSDDTRKILVFGHHEIVLDTIEHTLSQKNVTSIRICGKTPSSKRGELCRVFQEDPTVRVAVLSITAAGQGITLTAASVVIFAEIYWNPGMMQQAEDRAHRVGQKNSVLVKYMLARNTADDLIWPLIKNKTAVLEQVNLNAEKFTNATDSEFDADNGEYDLSGVEWVDDDADDVTLKPTASKKRKLH